MKTKIKAIIFDMDGVLIDAKEWHYEALNNALKLFGYEISRHDHLVSYDGLPTRKKLTMLSEQDGLPSGLHDLINQLKQKHTMDYVHRYCVPNFTHQFALSELARDGYKLAVGSNSISPTIETIMNKADLMRFLEFFLSADHVERGKPSPDIYLLAMKKLGVKPEECLILEDNFNGIKAAQASSAHVMQVHEVEDVTYWGIKEKVLDIEGAE
jgi:beta-phosphoglucomutase-like phosphatase (HAD superfamily)